MFASLISLGFLSASCVGNRAEFVQDMKALLHSKSDDISHLVNSGVRDIMSSLPSPMLPHLEHSSAGITVDFQLVDLTGADSLSFDITDFNLNMDNRDISLTLDADASFLESIFIHVRGPVTVTGVGSWIGLGGTYECDISADVTNIYGGSKIDFGLFLNNVGGLDTDAKLLDIDFTVPSPSSPSFQCAGNGWISDKIVSTVGQSLFSAFSWLTRNIGSKLTSPAKNFIKGMINRKLAYISPSLFTSALNKMIEKIQPNGVPTILKFMRSHTEEAMTLANQGVAEIQASFPNDHFPRMEKSMAGVDLDFQVTKLTGANNLNAEVYNFNMKSTPHSAVFTLDADLAILEPVNFQLLGKVSVSGIGRFFGLGGNYECEISGEISNIYGGADVDLRLYLDPQDGLKTDANVGDVDFTVPAPSSPVFRCSGNGWLADKVISTSGQAIFSTVSWFARTIGSKLTSPAKGFLKSIINKKLSAMSPVFFVNTFKQLNSMLSSY